MVAKQFELSCLHLGPYPSLQHTLLCTGLRWSTSEKEASKCDVVAKLWCNTLKQPLSKLHYWKRSEGCMCTCCVWLGVLSQYAHAQPVHDIVFEMHVPNTWVYKASVQAHNCWCLMPCLALCLAAFCSILEPCTAFIINKTGGYSCKQHARSL